MHAPTHSSGVANTCSNTIFSVAMLYAVMTPSVAIENAHSDELVPEAPTPAVYNPQLRLITREPGM